MLPTESASRAISLRCTEIVSAVGRMKLVFLRKVVNRLVCMCLKIESKIVGSLGSTLKSKLDLLLHHFYISIYYSFTSLTFRILPFFKTVFLLFFYLIKNKRRIINFTKTFLQSFPRIISKNLWKVSIYQAYDYSIIATNWRRDILVGSEVNDSSDAAKRGAVRSALFRKTIFARSACLRVDIRHVRRNGAAQA